MPDYIKLTDNEDGTLTLEMSLQGEEFTGLMPCSCMELIDNMGLDKAFVLEMTSLLFLT